METIVGTVIGFVLGYYLGSQDRKINLAEMRDSWQAITRSEQVQTLRAGLPGIIGLILQQGVQMLTGRGARD
jgi:hypothetical protein